MTPFEAYKTYIALKKHFTSESYDYFKYNGKLKLNQDNFLKRRDKFFYEKLARKNDLVNFLLSNLVLNPNIWIRDLLNDSAEQNYTSWLKRIQSLTYTISEETSNLLDDFDKNFVIEEASHPYLLQLYLSNKVSIETLCVLSDLVGFKSIWDKKLSDDIVWKEVSHMIGKYLRFINYDKEKIRQILVDKFTL